MEFKKNRQKIILAVHAALRAPDFTTMQLPPVLAQSKASRALERHKKGVRSQAERLKKRLQDVFERPSSYDPVYRTVQRLLKHKGPYNLSRDKEVRFEIRELVQKRFTLGYPEAGRPVNRRCHKLGVDRTLRRGEWKRGSNCDPRLGLRPPDRRQACTKRLAPGGIQRARGKEARDCPDRSSISRDEGRGHHIDKEGRGSGNSSHHGA